MANEAESARRFEHEAATGARFGFGENWKQFLERLTVDRIEDARQSLVAMLGQTSLEGKTFLDVGSGSGLFSLAARQLHARVTSFDLDPASVKCTEVLRSRFRPLDPDWRILRGSILDRAFVEGLPPHDIVYSWGVLHHTGRMHDAISSAAELVAPGGSLCLALYRETWLCPLWKIEKRLFCASRPSIKNAMVKAYVASVGALWSLKHRGEKVPRGMDVEIDARDWLGGYPYESITPRALKAFLQGRGFSVFKQVIKSEGKHLVPGCDEYVFRR